MKINSMKKCVNFMLLPICISQAFGQSIEPRNRITAVVRFSLEKIEQSSYKYEYTVENSVQSKQDIWNFMVIFSFSEDSIKKSFNVQNWWGPDMPISGPPFWISWSGPKDNKIKPGKLLSGFAFETSVLPGIAEYYCEGYAPPPSFPEGMATDSIPGYTDLTPYGPGVVGKTVGPVMPPDPFEPATFLDTLLSYIHQSHELGWINNTRDDDAEADERAEDGIVKNLDKRLMQTRDLIVKDKIGAAKGRLAMFLNKIERLWDRQQKEEKRNRKNPKIVFTSEAYALLKYNGEYLLDHLTEPKEGKDGKDKGREEKKGREK
jgi:hypothetical protein